MPNINQQANKAYKKLQNLAVSNSNRFTFNEPFYSPIAINPEQIWIDQNNIPNIAPTLTNGQINGVVQKFIDLTLIPVAGTVNSFYHVDLVDCIPHTYGDGISYNITLKDNINNIISLGQNDWEIDRESGVVTFFGNIVSGAPSGDNLPPSNMPPKITFYKYIGAKSNAVISLNETSGIANDYEFVSSLNTYSPNIIYLVKVATNNTGVSTININDIGVKQIKKNESGTLVDLEADDLQIGITYLLVYDNINDVFQIASGSGSGSGGGNTSMKIFDVAELDWIDTDGTNFHFEIQDYSQYGFDEIGSVQFYGLDAGNNYDLNTIDVRINRVTKSIILSSLEPQEGLLRVVGGGDVEEIGGTGGTTLNLNDLGDVELTSPQLNDVLVYNGTNWVNDTIDLSVTYTEGVGVDITSDVISIDLQNYNVPNDINLTSSSGTVGITATEINLNAPTYISSTLNVGGLASYDIDYSSSYTDRSLVDNGWIKNLSSKGQILYVSPDGSDTRTQYTPKGVHSYPYQTITAAKNASSSGDVIMVLPGTYDETNLGKSGVTYYFHRGAIINHNGSNGLPIFNFMFLNPYSVLGYGDFINNDTTVSNAGAIFNINTPTYNGTTINLEFNSAKSYRTAMHISGNSTILLYCKFNRMEVISSVTNPVVLSLASFGGTYVPSGVNGYGKIYIEGHLIKNNSNGHAISSGFYGTPTKFTPDEFTLKIDTVQAGIGAFAMNIRGIQAKNNFNLDINKVICSNRGVLLYDSYNITNFHIRELSVDSSISSTIDLIEFINIGTSTKKEFITIDKIYNNSSSGDCIVIQQNCNIRLKSNQVYANNGRALSASVKGSATSSTFWDVELDIPLIEGNTSTGLINVTDNDVTTIANSSGSAGDNFIPVINFLPPTTIKNNNASGYGIVFNNGGDYRHMIDIRFNNNVTFDTNSYPLYYLLNTSDFTNYYFKLFGNMYSKMDFRTPTMGSKSLTISSVIEGNTYGFDFLTNHNSSGSAGADYYKYTTYPIFYTAVFGDNNTSVIAQLKSIFDSYSLPYTTTANTASIVIADTDIDIDFCIKNNIGFSSTTTTTRIGKITNLVPNSIITITNLI